MTDAEAKLHEACETARLAAALLGSGKITPRQWIDCYWRNIMESAPNPKPRKYRQPIVLRGRWIAYPFLGVWGDDQQTNPWHGRIAPPDASEDNQR